MTTDLVPPDLVAPPSPRSSHRPGALRLVGALTAYGLRSFVRNPLAAFFTVGMPLLFLVIIASLFGNEVVEPRGGVRIAQFFTPALAVFGAAQAAYCGLAGDVALMRERGVAKRLRNAPVPAWALLAGRICATVVVATGAVVLVFAVGVAVYDVQVRWRTVPAAVVTLLVSVAAFAALGLAAAAVLRSASAVQVVTTGSLICLAFISDVFTVSAHQPLWLERLGWIFPLKHFANAFADAFNPFVAGNGFAADHLAVVAGWGVAGGLVAVRWFTWEPRATAGRAAPRVVTGGGGGGPLRGVTRGRPGTAVALGTQIGYALTGLRRDTGTVFFALVFPVLLLALFPVLMATSAADRTEAAAKMLPAMTAYALAVLAYSTLPQTVAQARERGVLTRLAGTPVPRWAYLGGQVVAALGATAATTLALVAVAVAGYGVRLDPARLPAAAFAVVLGVGCFATVGFALLAVVRSTRAVAVVTLGTLLPLSFISDVFVVGARVAGPFALVADVLPLKHAVHALDAALLPGLAGAGFAWTHLAVLGAWTVAGALASRWMIRR